MTSDARSLKGLPGQLRPGWVSRDELQVRTDELSLLLKITNVFDSGWEAHEILDSLYEEFQQVLPFDRLEYAVLDESGYVLTTEWFRATYESKLIPVGYRYRRAVPMTGNSQYRVTYLDNDLPSYALNRPPDHPVSLLVAEGIRSSLSCPLIVGDEVKGYLFFNTLRFDGYTPHHADLIQLIAGRVASILEQSRLHEELKAQNQKLRDLEQSRLEFIASISHELRTPLTAVVGFASELRDRVQSFSAEEVSQFVDVIAAQSNEVAGIVEDLLVITRAEAGHLSISMGPVNLASEVRAVSSSIPCDRPHQQIRTDLTDVVVWADPLRVRQVVRNLLSNAARYGGDDVSVAITIEGPQVVTVVADDGPGIPEEDRVMVFQAYGRSELSEGKPGSIGLGLTVSRYLAEAMDGALSYDRVDGQSRFSLALPRYLPGQSRYNRL